MRHNTRLKKQVCCLHNLFSELSLVQARHLLAFLSTKRLINAVLVVHSSHSIPLIFSMQSRISPTSIPKADGYCHVRHSITMPRLDKKHVTKPAYTSIPAYPL